MVELLAKQIVVYLGANSRLFALNTCYSLRKRTKIDAFENRNTAKIAIAEAMIQLTILSRH